MMIETLERTQDFSGRILDAFSAQEDLRAEDPLASTRAAAMGEFQRLGLPTKKNEAWKYTRIEKVLRHPYGLVSTGAETGLTPESAAKLRLPDLDAHLVVVVNGAIRQDLSDFGGLPAGVEVRPLLEFIRENPEEAREHVTRLLDDDKDPFAALNTAFANDGVFLRVPKGITLDRPLQIAFLTDLDRDAIIQPRNLYVFGENCEAMVVETFQSVGEAKVFNNAVTEVLVDQAARVNLLKLQFESDHADRIDTTQVVQQNGASHFAGHTYTLGGGLVRNNMNVRPAGHGCESHLYGLYILSGEQHVDNHTLIDHAAPGCFSNELYRGIVDDDSTGVFNGKVFVRRDSQQTNAYQSSQGVVLSENATHYSKPELEIYADDVKCSHGSTTGELEPEHVFYLRSRGIDKVTAKSLLLYAFAKDIVDQLPHEALRQYLDGLIEERIVRSAAK